MATARDVMRGATTTVLPDAVLSEVAEILWDADVDAVCVVERGQLMGIVTEMDLVFQQHPVHLSSVVKVMSALEPLFGQELQEQLPRLSSMMEGTVRDVMKPPIHVAPDTPLEEVANVVFSNRLPLVPVVHDGELVGIVTRRGLLRHAYGL